MYPDVTSMQQQMNPNTLWLDIQQILHWVHAELHSWPDPARVYWFATQATHNVGYNNPGFYSVVLCV